jgi:hypothetical protein
MKIKSKFHTMKEAREYLEVRGWRAMPGFFRGTIFSHPEFNDRGNRRRSIEYFAGHYQIEAY